MNKIEKLSLHAASKERLSQHIRGQADELMRSALVWQSANLIEKYKKWQDAFNTAV